MTIIIGFLVMRKLFNYTKGDLYVLRALLPRIKTALEDADEREERMKILEENKKFLK